MEADHQDDHHIMIMEEMKRYIKGKRSKRKRPASSALTDLTLACSTTTSSSSTTTTTTTTTGARANPSVFHMPTTTSIDFTNILQDNHDADEDMANCLILLAHGAGDHLPPPPPLYDYECKSCNRSFTSFQALGGHRASHNKPHHKDVVIDHCQPSKNRKIYPSINPNNNLLCSPSGLTKGPKVHECSICGSEFTSGQALGGHMRRHRSMSMSTSHDSKKHKTLLSLDLNLPAPMDDDHKETKFRLGSSNQMNIVFSATSLVDSHF